MEKILLLKFHGIIELSQFWPHSVESDGKIIYGQSDADTIKVLIDKKQGFLIKRHPYASCEKTRVFNNVLISGKVNKAPIDSKGYVTVRLQGIDAPELHFKPDIKKNVKNLSQHFGQTAVVELHKMLSKHAMNNKIECVVKSYVEKPEDAFDCYGRFVGDVILMKDDREFLNVNHKLAEDGLVYPTYYTSMTNGEIRAMQLMVRTAISKKHNLWEHHYSKKLGDLPEITLEYKVGKKGRYSPTRDRRLPVYMPKIFRRQYKYEATKNGKSFKEFLAYEKPGDICYLIEDFFKEGRNENNKKFLSDLFNGNGEILFKPWDLVFEEAESKLIDAKTKKVIKNLEF
jgi:endonuclease YncB( thermonuclease family)